MADDDRDLIARTESITEKRDGRPMSADEMATDFALHGLKKRTIALERFDNELRGEIDASPHNLRRRARLMALRQKMGGIHEALRKARR